jgi:hypothetical protein
MTINKEIPQLITVNTKHYHFDYIDIQYDNNIISPMIEIFRWEKFQELKHHIKTILVNHNLKPIKRNMDDNITNVMVRLIFEGFSHKIQHLRDGLFNIVKDSKSLKNDLQYTFKQYNKPLNDIIIMQIYNEINLSYIVDNIIKDVNIFSKNLTSHKKNKSYKYKLYKSHIVNKNLGVTLISNNKKIISHIPQAVYIKLKKRFLEYCKKNPSFKKNKCDDFISCILIRYTAISSLGNQMGIPIPAKNQYKKCNIDFEGFASSLNHYYKYYCSMFYDLEKYFGSLGSYMNITYKRGVYMHNPPYEKKLLTNMVNIIIYSMQNSNEKLCFFFGTPLWEKYTEFKLHDTVHNSNFFKKKFIQNDFEFPWYNFIGEDYAKIPKGVRYVMANYIINIKCIKDATLFWKNMKY